MKNHHPWWHCATRSPAKRMDSIGEDTLFILGAVPPPRGGVSTHIERLLPHLEKDGINHMVWDHSRVTKASQRIVSLRSEPLKIVRRLLQKGRKSLYYPITRITVAKTMALLALRLFNTRLVLMLVASYAQTIGDRSVKRALLRALMQGTDHIVVNNTEFYDRMILMGGKASRLSVMPAFIPESAVDIERRPLNAAAHEFCKQFSPLILVYAYGPDRHQGVDLYGLDMAVELLKDLQPEWPGAGLVAVLPEITDADYFNEVSNAIQRMELTSRVLIPRGDDISFSAFLQKSDVFIRPTNTDGDALTVREAISSGVATVASDVCPRPEGTVTFKNRNRIDLHRNVQRSLKGKLGRIPDAANPSRTARRLIRIFQNSFKH